MSFDRNEIGRANAMRQVNGITLRAAQGSIIVSKGGILLIKDGQLLGAVGSSGGSAEQDQACSEAGARAGGFEFSQ